MCCNTLFKIKMFWVYYKLIYDIYKETPEINVVSWFNIAIKKY